MRPPTAKNLSGSLPASSQKRAMLGSFSVMPDDGLAQSQSQLDKFKEAARELGTDDDPARFEERLRKLVKHKPVPDEKTP